MKELAFGTLERTDLRQAWKHEAEDFTPWLAQNLDRLSEQLGIELELEDTEVSVGPFHADIVARVPIDGARVLIENQLEETDHRHLGQLMTYLAGLDAQIVLWIAAGFNESHLSAIRWLNEHTSDPFAFFAVRVRTVRIGNSPVAPVFDVLERPNEWDRQVRERSRGTSELSQFRRGFWEHVMRRKADAPRLRPGFASSYVVHNTAIEELHVAQFLAKDRVGVYLTSRGRDVNTLELIEPHRKRLSEALDEDLSETSNEWCTTSLWIDSHNRDNWNEMADWLDHQRQAYQEGLRRSNEEQQA